MAGNVTPQRQLAVIPLQVKRSMQSQYYYSIPDSKPGHAMERKQNKNEMELKRIVGEETEGRCSNKKEID